MLEYPATHLSVHRPPFLVDSLLVDGPSSSARFNTKVSLIVVFVRKNKVFDFHHWFGARPAPFRADLAFAFQRKWHLKRARNGNSRSLSSSDVHPRRSCPSNLSTPLVPSFLPTMQPKARIISLTVIAALAFAHPLPRDPTPSGACTP
jgi:hypothetical protein